MQCHIIRTRNNYIKIAQRNSGTLCGAGFAWETGQFSSPEAAGSAGILWRPVRLPCPSLGIQPVYKLKLCIRGFDDYNFTKYTFNKYMIIILINTINT